ncbi:hypothetical protein bsdtb5_36250 [Anaeromicropila herbilytica]|uniref:Uncharacterized protein n=1 Tax=Anaeromicropila herbilytica TaxID=2785025 RepID=A0A7R7EPH9_9FIRM|nr:hypothetical protein bsdtb5_36250 [Anaeromicropila herbilytica]
MMVQVCSIIKENNLRERRTYMDAPYFYISILAIIVLNCNFAIMKFQEKKNYNIFIFSIISMICEMIIFMSIIQICSK